MAYKSGITWYMTHHFDHFSITNFHQILQKNKNNAVFGVYCIDATNIEDGFR